MNKQPLATCDSHDSVRQIESLLLRQLNGTVRSLKLTVRDDGLVLRGHTRHVLRKTTGATRGDGAYEITHPGE